MADDFAVPDARAFLIDEGPGKGAANQRGYKEVIAQESLVVNWFANHHIPLSILRRKSMEKFGKSMELVKAGATRFGTNTLVGERLIELKAPLAQTVVDEEYVEQRYRDEEDQEEETHGVIHRRQHKGATAKKLVQDDGENGFWERVEQHVKISAPAQKMLRRHDSSAPTVGKLCTQAGMNLASTLNAKRSTTKITWSTSTMNAGHMGMPILPLLHMYLIRSITNMTKHRTRR